jgi:hypothetical protein
MTRIEIVQTQPEYVGALAAMQALVFPTIAAEECFSEAMYRAQIDAFPDGQLTALLHDNGGTVVIGGTTTFRTNLRFDGDLPYYFDIIGRGYLTCHDPDGEWLYGVDISVHPDYRRLGAGSRFYDARRGLVRRLNLRGEIVAGMLPGYERYRDGLTVARYVNKVIIGELTDPTLTWQLKNGFRVERLLQDYVHDPRSDDTCTLLRRENPHYLERGAHV